MKLVLDENLPRSLATALAAAGFDVQRVALFAPSADDARILALAVREVAVVVTADKDFGELVYQRAHAFEGVVLIRLHPIPDQVQSIVASLVTHRAELEGAFVVLNRAGVRIRRREG